MAKDSDKGAGKGAKGSGGAKKTRLPKEVGGVKVPKKLRKLGNKAVKAVTNPVVSEVVAGAMLAAAAALREGKDPKAAAGRGTRAGRDGPEDVKKQAGRLSDSLRALAIDLARRTLDGIEERRGAAGSARSEPSEGGGSVPEQSGRKAG